MERRKVWIGFDVCPTLVAALAGGAKQVQGPLLVASPEVGVGGSELRARFVGSDAGRAEPVAGGDQHHVCGVLSLLLQDALGEFGGARVVAAAGVTEHRGGERVPVPGLRGE